MRTSVTRFTCAAALALAFGVASAAAQRSARADIDTPAGQNDTPMTTISGCLEQNAYDQYLLVASGQISRGAHEAVGTIGTSTPSTTATSTRYRLLLQTDVDLSHEVGKAVQVTGRVLGREELRTDHGVASPTPVGTTARADPNADRSNAQSNPDRQVFGVVAVEPTSGSCPVQTTPR